MQEGRIILRLAVLLVAGSVSAADLWVDATAAAGGDGSRQKPFQKIQSAAEIAVAGDIVHVLPGTYRERVMPEHGGAPGKPVVYRSEVPLGAVVKGSDVWKPEWHDEGGGIFSGGVDEKLFTDTNYVDGGNPYRIAYYWEKERALLPPSPFKSVTWTLGQVFVDDQSLKETSSRNELNNSTNAWWFDPVANRIYIKLGGINPPNRKVEITTRRGVFRPFKKGLGYIELHGFVFAHCANQFPANFWVRRENLQSGMVGTRDGHHWVIEGNIFRDAKSIGLTFGNAGGKDQAGVPFDNEIPAQPEPAGGEFGSDRIEGNLFLNNGAVGAMGRGHTDVVFRKNIFAGNNALLNTSYESGGIKTHQATRMLVEQNWFLDNEAQGIWLDNTWTSCRIERNLFAGNRGKDIFFEMNDSQNDTATMVDHNFFLPGRPSLPAAGREEKTWQPWSTGIYGHDADGVRITHNLFAGEGYGLYFRKMVQRQGGAAFINATGNIFAGKKMTAVCLPVENPPLVRSNWFNENIYPAGGRPFAATGWSSPNKIAKGVDRVSLDRFLQRAGKDADQFIFGDLARATAGYFVTLNQWRDGMGFDRASFQSDVKCEFDRASGTVTLDVPADVLKAAASDKTVAGPFENLKTGAQRFQLPRPDESFFKEYPEVFYGKSH